MLTKIQPVLLLLLALQLFACNPTPTHLPTDVPMPTAMPAPPAPPAPPPNLPVSIAPDESFRLKVSQQGELEAAGLTIQFQTVLNDTRCPSQVNCAEAGNATVVMDVWLADQEPTQFKVNINPPPFERDVLYDAYQIRLLKLDPYPATIGQIIPQEDYRATLVVINTSSTQSATATPTGPVIAIVERGDGPSLEAETYYQKGLTYVAAGLPSEAIANLTEAISLYPAYIEAYKIRGDVYSDLLRFDLARADYQQILTLNPDPEMQAIVTAALEEIVQAQSVLPTVTPTAPLAPATPLPSRPIIIMLNEPFSLKLNQRGILEAEEVDIKISEIQGLTIEFSAIVEDSRCPRQVDCFWSGQARITIYVWQTGQEPTAFELNTLSSLNQNMISYDAYQIRLLSLGPYPETPEPKIALEDYRATFEVSKN